MASGISGKRLLGDWRAAAFALVVCIYEALPRSVTTLRAEASPGPHGRDGLLIFGLAWASLIAISIAARSIFIGDRFVFGAAGSALVLRLAEMILLPGAAAKALMRGVSEALWVTGAVACVVVLGFSLRGGSRRGPELTGSG